MLEANVVLFIQLVLFGGVGYESRICQHPLANLNQVIIATRKMWLLYAAQLPLSYYVIVHMHHIYDTAFYIFTALAGWACIKLVLGASVLRNLYRIKASNQ